MLVSNYWPLTLAMTVPAAPRMSTELRVWCLPMTALRTRSNSAKRSCTTSWSSSRFSGKRRGTSRLGHVSRKTLKRLTKVLLIPKPNYHAQFAITNFYLHSSKSVPSHPIFVWSNHRWSIKYNGIQDALRFRLRSDHSDNIQRRSGTHVATFFRSLYVSWAICKDCLHRNDIIKE